MKYRYGAAVMAVSNIVKGGCKTEASCLPFDFYYSPVFFDWWDPIIAHAANVAECRLTHASTGSGAI